MRTAAVWVPDWPVVGALAAADTPAHLPAAILRGNRVQVANATARKAGIYRGMRKRSAQGLCPQLLLYRHDDARDAVQFEPVAQALEQVVAGLEVMRPGLALLPAGGAARYYGSEAALAALLVEACASAGFESQVGIADSMFAAVVAAREQVILAPGAAPGFLHERLTAELLGAVTDPAKAREVQGVIELWQRLGVHTLGDLVALPSQALTNRFGELGIWARQLASGADVRPAALRRPETELFATTDFDPPADRVEAAAFAAQSLAAELSAKLAERGLACGHLRVTAVTEQGEATRLWRGDDAAVGGMTAAQMARRVCWQLEGWLSARQPGGSRRQGRAADSDMPGDFGGDVSEAPAPVIRLTLSAEDVVPAAQPQLWGSATATMDNAARRALERVQGILGQDGVQAAVIQGGRTPAERIQLAAFGEAWPDTKPLNQPWPDSLPDPAPTHIYSQPIGAALVGAAGATVIVEPRLPALSEPPVALVVPAAAPHSISQDVVAWAGPWLLPTRWWESPPSLGGGGDAAGDLLPGDSRGGGPDAYLQVVTASGSAWLLKKQPDLSGSVSSSFPAPWAIVGEYA